MRAKHDVVVRFLEAGLWKEPYAKQLKNHEGLVEIVITKGVAHRLIGFHGIGRDEFTVVLTCTHKGKQYDPKHALDTAADRMKEVKEGRKQIVKYCNKPVPRVRRSKGGGA